MRRLCNSLSVIMVLGFLSLPAMALDYPQARRENTTDTYHGVKVEDPYQWLEDWLWFRVSPDGNMGWDADSSGF